MRWAVLLLVLAACKPKHEGKPLAKPAPQAVLADAAPAPPPRVAPTGPCVRNTGGAFAEIKFGALRVCSALAGEGDAMTYECVAVSRDGAIRIDPEASNLEVPPEALTIDRADDRRSVTVCHGGKDCHTMKPELAPGEELDTYSTDDAESRLITTAAVPEAPVAATIDVWDLETGARIAGRRLRSTGDPTAYFGRAVGGFVAIFEQRPPGATSMDVTLYSIEGDQLRPGLQLHGVDGTPTRIDDTRTLFVERLTRIDVVDPQAGTVTATVPLDWLVDRDALGWKEKGHIDVLTDPQSPPVLLATVGIMPGTEMRVGFLDLDGGKHVRVDVPICPGH